MDRDTVPPEDCSASALSQWERLYCFRAVAPDTAQRRITSLALDRVAQRGGDCLLIAQRGRELLAAGQIRFFEWQEGDAGGYGHRNTGIQLDADYARLYTPEAPYFERVLVHEIDHVLGYSHLEGQPLETPHTALCG
jgi:hypothetical protein